MAATRQTMSTNLANDPFEDAVKALKPTTKVTLDTLVTLFRAQSASLKSHYEDLIAAKDQEIAELKQRSSVLEDRCDAIEQYSRRNTVRIRGIPEDPKVDNVAGNTDSVVIEVVKAKMGIDIFENDIIRCHRIGKAGDGIQRDIIVKFICHRKKTQLMGARKKLAGSGIFINEDLTSLRAKLSYKVRCLKRQKQLQDTWIYDGVVFAKLLDNKVVKMTTDSQYDEHFHNM